MRRQRGSEDTHEDPREGLVVETLETRRHDTDTGGSADDAHGGRDGDSVLRGQEDSDSRAELHRESTRGRVHGETVTEGGHDIVPVGRETDNEHASTEGEHPDGGGRVGRGNNTVGPDVVDGGKRTDGVGNVVGAVGKLE